jgi:integrase
MRRANGALYQSKGSWFVSLSLRTRISFRLATCQTRPEAELRRTVLADVAGRLKSGGHLDVAETFCRQAAVVPDDTLPKLLALVTGLLQGRERVEPTLSSTTHAGTLSGVTFGEFAQRWTRNDLALEYRRRLKAIDHTENILRLGKHVYPVIFRGRTIADTPLQEFTIEHAEHVLQQPTLPDGSVRHVAQCLSRVLSLAAYPARLIACSPLPRGWLPPQNPTKARSYLFPLEEGLVMGNTRMPLVRRVFLGFCAREGPRVSNVVNLRWDDLTLDLPNGAGRAVVDRTKNGEPIHWALDPGTAEALRRWRTICPSTVWVFPAEAIPRYRRRNAGQPMCIGSIATQLRLGLKQAGVMRAQLFEQSGTRIRLRAHDLRATFITLALMNGRTEDWVRTRTGHKTSQMIARYRREAATAAELALGCLSPLHDAIPELAELDKPAELDSQDIPPSRPSMLPRLPSNQKVKSLSMSEQLPEQLH